MNEMLLHYFWKNKIFSVIDLKTTDKRPISLIHPGYSHQDEGPDFKQAIIKIDNIIWAGDVEIHIHTSDWLRHGHQYDAKYQSVILHVVFYNDTDICPHLPTLELKSYISMQLIEEYEKLSLNPHFLPCRAEIPNFSSLQLSEWFSRLAIERLNRKQKNILNILQHHHGNWAETTYQLFSIAFGFRTNQAAFELLAKQLPYKYLLKHKDSQLQIYALIFGQAGLLEKEILEDEYYQTLQMEYHYLKYKYTLTAIPEKIWNHLRLRPHNFPCIRLAQLSECLYRIPHLMDNILHSKDIHSFTCIEKFSPNNYWKNHLHFGRISPLHTCNIGKQSLNSIIINTLIPIRMAYSTFIGDSLLQENTLYQLEKIDFEHNRITRQYEQAGFPNDNALCSQAILELQERYCSNRQCLRCHIGCQILKKY